LFVHAFLRPQLYKDRNSDNLSLIYVIDIENERFKPSFVEEAFAMQQQVLNTNLLTTSPSRNIEPLLHDPGKCTDVCY